ncbi:MAG TPA: wax ester/triacylglycerol synthase family O-acyltransferase [Micromonosporaceae bacterium]
MEHLSPLDAGFLDAEDEDRHASLAIASVAVVEGPMPDRDEFLRMLGERVPSIPRYRQKVRTVPFDLGQPVWVDDPRFDLDRHVLWTAIPEPTDDALCRLVARIMSQRLDRDRPLWQCWVIKGLADGRWAILSKVHHCMADGLSGNQLYSLTFDDSPHDRRRSPGGPAPAWNPPPEPSTTRLTVLALADLARTPMEQVRLVGRAMRTPAALARRVADTARGLTELAGVLRPVTRSSLSGPIGAQRRYGVARALLPDIVGTARAFGVTVNDVVLSAVTGAFRALLLHRDEQPVPDAVRSLVPVSVRAPDQGGVIDNRISMMLPLLPVDVADPVERLGVVHVRLAALKASKEAEAGEAMTTLARHEPFAPISWAVRFAARLPQRNIVTVTTNVPGPPRTLYALGRPIVEILPYVPIALRLRTGIAMLSYHGQLSFGITWDDDSTPEVELLAGAIERELAVLVAAARARADTATQPG